LFAAAYGEAITGKKYGFIRSSESFTCADFASSCASSDLNPSSCCLPHAKGFMIPTSTPLDFRAKANAEDMTVFPISVSVAVTKYDFNDEALPCCLIKVLPLDY
jgi:hypothetical protein